MVCVFFITREPPRQEKHGGQFRDLRWLKADRAESDPAARTVDPHSEMRNVTRHQRYQCDTEPNPPRPLPKMVIDQRGGNANNQTDAEPDRLSFEKEQRVAVAVSCKSAGAEKHHDADD